MEGYGAWAPTQPGYLNPDTAFFYPRPEITGNNLTLYQVYVSPQGNDAASNNGVITSPFATISAALFYVTTVSVAFPTPLSAPVCIFVAPGTYEGGFSVPDNVYLIGPSNAPEPVIIAGSIFVSPSSSSSPTGLQNLTLNGLTVAGAFYNANVEIRNCRIQTETIFSALTIAPDDPLVTATVSATECVFSSSETGNVSLISGNTTENTYLTLDNCQLVSNAEEGVLIDMTGSLTVRNCSLLNTGVGTTLSPLILLQSGETLTPTVSLEGSVLKYEDVTEDVGGSKLAIRFNAPLQPITAKMTNCTISIFLGGAATDIIENTGAQNVTLTQSANSCLLDGKTINTTNMVLTAAHFLQDSPLPPGPGAGVATLNTLSGDITLDGAGGISVGSAGNTITITGSGVASLASLTGAVTISSPSNTIAIATDGQDITLESAGIITATAGDGIEITGTQDITIANIGVVSLVSGEYTNVTEGEGHAWTIDNTGVQTFNSYTGAVTISGGAGIELGGTEPDIEISNAGVLSVAALTGAVTITSPDESVGIAVIDNDIQFTVPAAPVASVGGKTGTVTFEEGDGIAITYGESNAAPINIANTGVISLTAGTGISLTGDTPQNPTINCTLSGFVESGTIDQTGFSAVTTGPYAGYGFYLKQVTNASMNANGIILATTGGTPLASSQAWLITVEPTAGGFDIYTADDPVVTDETWQLHYGIISYGTAP